MSTTVPGLRLRKVFGRENWLVPQPMGPDGWRMFNREGSSSVIVTATDWTDGREYIHASIAHLDRMPTYDELVLLHKAAYGHGWAYQVFAPPQDHVNINKHALHLWGLVSGEPILPNFGFLGSI